MDTTQTTALPQTSSRDQVGILIPCYNEESRIASVIVGCQQFASTIYVCDDGSEDLTGEIAKKMGAIVLRHEHNMGYGAAIRTLFDAAADANLRVVVTFDGDGQHLSDCIPGLVEPILKKESDIVIGSRFLDKNHLSKIPAHRKLGIKAITGTSNKLTSLDLTDTQSGLRAYDIKLLRKIAPSEMGMSASTEILSKAASDGARIKEIPTEIVYNDDSSTHNPFVHAADVVFGMLKQYSLKHALLFYGVPGFGALLIALIFWLLLIGSFASTQTIETNFAILAIGFTMVGFVLVTTAMILWTIISVVRSAATSNS